MKNKNLEFFLDGVIVLVVLGLGIMFAVRYFTASGKLNADAVAARFRQYAATEAIFKSRYTNYQGSCTDLALPSGVQCSATATTYKIEETLSDGTVYCTDSAGFMGQLSGPTPGAAPLCR